MTETETDTDTAADDVRPPEESADSGDDSGAGDDENLNGNDVGDDAGDDMPDDMSDDEYKQTVSQLVRVGLSPTFSHEVEETIRQRSGGRFFGRKAFGERIPYEVIGLLILAIGLIAFFVIRSSTTGSLRYEQKQEPPKIAPGAKDVVPQPKPLE